MEILFEFLLELIFEGSLEISSNKKISKYIRCPLIVLIFLFFAAAIFLIFFTGFLSYKMNKIVGIVFFAIGIVMIFATISKFKKLYLSRK